MRRPRQPEPCTTPHPNGLYQCDRDMGHDDGWHYYLPWQMDSRGTRHPLPPVWWTEEDQ